MRLLLALALVMCGEAANAACSQSQLAGTWKYSRIASACTFEINSVGIGTANCSKHGTFAVKLTLTNDCKISGFIKQIGPDYEDKIVGRADPSVTTMVGSVAIKITGHVAAEGPFTAFRK